MSDETSRNVPLGWHDDQRMAEELQLGTDYLKL